MRNSGTEHSNRVALDSVEVSYRAKLLLQLLREACREAPPDQTVKKLLLLADVTEKLTAPIVAIASTFYAELSAQNLGDNAASPQPAAGPG